MAIDLSTLNSISSLLGTTYGTSTASTNQSTANFEDYLMNALNASDTKDKTTTNGLYDLISNSGNTSVLSGLMNSGSSTDAGLNAIDGYDAYAALMGGNNSSTNPFDKAASTSDAFSNYLQSSFESTMMKNMNAAKAKLQTSYEDFVAKVGENPSDAAKLRIQQMEQNISMVTDFMAGKTNSASSQDKQLSELLGNNSSINASDLVNQLKGNSTLLDWLTNASNSSTSSTTNSQDLLNQLSVSGNYYQNLLNQ